MLQWQSVSVWISSPGHFYIQEKLKRETGFILEYNFYQYIVAKRTENTKRSVFCAVYENREKRSKYSEKERK